MSREFTDDQANFLRATLNSDILVDADFTFAMYCKPDRVNVSQWQGGLGANGEVQEPRTMAGIDDTGHPRGFVDVGNGTETACNAVETATHTVGEWKLYVVGWDVSADTVYHWFDSSTPVTDTQTTTPNVLDFDMITLGGTADSSVASPFDGLIAQFMCWPALLLSNSDVASLLAAVTTAQLAAVQSGSLRFHYPLEGSDLSDREGTEPDLTVNGTVNFSTDEPLGAAGSYLSMGGIIANP